MTSLTEASMLDMVCRMQLTPLHFGRYIFHTSPQPVYGASYYHTDCGRFALRKDADVQWYIDSVVHTSWFAWLSTVGLINTPFPTRRDALEALATAIDADGAMDAEQGWSYIPGVVSL